jgi:RimJ/RimL family protein N-acetyltransferase
MELRNLKPEDLAFCRVSNVSRSKFLEPAEQSDWAWTLEHESQIMGCGGIQTITDVCAWAWITMTEAGKGEYREVFRAVNAMIEGVCEEHGILRLQAWMEIGFEESRRFLEHMHFTPEGFPMLQFIEKDKHAQMYVRYFGRHD